MSTTNPSDDDATHQHDSSDDEFKDADRCGCDECRPVVKLRPQALSIPYVVIRVSCRNTPVGEDPLVGHVIICVGEPREALLLCFHMA